MSESSVPSAPAASPAPMPPATPTPRSQTLAIIAIALAAVALITAFIPGLTLITWLPGIAALVLGIIALVKKQHPGLSITAIVVAPIAIVIAIVMGIVYAAAAISAGLDAVTGGGSTVSAPSSSATTGDGAPTAPASGTRDHPVAIGSTISNDDWTVVVNSYNADGNAIVSGANMFNQPPAAGSHYEIVNYTVTYKGVDSSYANFVQVDLVTTDGTVLDGTEALVSLQDGFTLDELYAGGSATGSKGFLVPDGATGVLRVKPGILADPVFVATK